MFEQAWSKVTQIDATCGRSPDQHSQNFAGALVVSVKSAGLCRIDTVTLSDDGARAFASEQVLGRTFQRHASVDVATAVGTPLAQSAIQAAAMPAPTDSNSAAIPDPTQAQGVAPVAR